MVSSIRIIYDDESKFPNGYQYVDGLHLFLHAAIPSIVNLKSLFSVISTRFKL